MDVYMPRDKMNRSDHRGFGFVTFETQGALARIMTHDGPHQIRCVCSVPPCVGRTAPLTSPTRPDSTVYAGHVCKMDLLVII